MNRKSYFYGIGAALGMLLLILDTRTAITGAQEGLELCIRTVIPSLFPFFLLSGALTSSLAGMRLPFFRPLGRLCGIPPGCEGILISGFLGGYPVGAQAVALAHGSGQLSRSQANRMLAFCNNAGPSFLFGMATGCFPGAGYAWLLWGIHLFSAVMVSLLLPKGVEAIAAPGGVKSTSMPELMKRSLIIMANVCGWVIVFRVLIVILNRWIFWALPDAVRVLLSGLLELTNGCCMLPQVENMGLRFVLCSGMLSFGGLCVTMQTFSVIGSLSSRTYLAGKLMQTVVSLVLAFICQCFFEEPVQLSISPLWITLAAALTGVVIAAKRQKNSSNPISVGV